MLNLLRIYKVIFLFLFLFLMQNNSYSQRIKWEEKFESLNIENNGWEFINNDSSAVTATFYSSFDFFNISSQSALSGNNFLKYNFVNANYNNLIDDWVITPKLFDISESDTISFWCGAMDKKYKDSLKVYVSVTDNELSSFVLIDHFKVDGPAGAWHKKSYDMSAYKGKNIYFALNYYLRNAGPQGISSDNVWIDNFTLTGKGYGGPDADSYELNQNFPNPFNPSTQISFTVPENSNVLIKIYDVLGKEVLTLANGFFEKGKYSLNFDGNNYASGVYFYSMTSVSSVNTKTFSETRKMELIK